MTYARKAQAPSAAPPLKIGQPDDAFEHEADRTADEVMSGTGPRAQWSFSRMSIAPPVQRKCACGGSGDGECEDCKEQKLQRKASGAAEMGHAPAIVHDVLRSSGAPLDRATRSFFEPRFGHDFGNVRIHTGAQAAASAQAVNALAYTVGDSVVFGSGQYAPHSAAGRKLLAHELTHVAQQSGGGRTVSRSPRAVQRVTADRSAIPKSIKCLTDQGPKGTSGIRITAVKLKGLDAEQKKQVAEFYKTWRDAGAKDFIAVEGYASAETEKDSAAQQSANWTSSCYRTELVQDALLRLGVPSKLILTWGHGETDQFAPVGKDPGPNRRVELSLISMSKAGTPSASASGADAPTSIQVKGTADEKGTQADVKTTGGKQQAATGSENKPVGQPQQTTDDTKHEGDKPKAGGDDDKPFSITTEFDLKGEYNLAKTPQSPPSVPKPSFLCDHGVYQIGFKWNKGIKVFEDRLEIANEPEFDVDILDPACSQNPSLTLQVNAIKLTIFKKLLEADLVGILGLPDGWATGLAHFPFTGGGQIKVELTPFKRKFPDLAGIKIGGYGGISFEQGVGVPGTSEEKRTGVLQYGLYVGIDTDFDFSSKKK
jgi:hypothetical protein